MPQDEREPLPSRECRSECKELFPRPSNNQSAQLASRDSGQAYQATSQQGTSFNATYSSSTNRITTIGSLVPTYDANGNLTNDTAHAYTWDAEGHMLNVDSGTSGGVCDTYDALGRMVEKATGASCSSSYTEIVYAPSGGRLATMTGQTLQTASVPLVGGAEAVYNSSGLLAYRHSDHLGSSRFASTPSRTKYFDVAYAPYGENYAGSGTTDLSFTGQKQDTASWMYDFLFRKYNAAHGRWMSPDPAGIAASSPGSPQTWNRYAYIANSPLSGVDQLGLLMCLENPCASGGGGSDPGYGTGAQYGTDWGAAGPWGDGVNYAGGSQGGAGMAACGVDIFCRIKGGIGPFGSPVANGSSWVGATVGSKGGVVGVWAYYNTHWSYDNGFSLGVGVNLIFIPSTVVANNAASNDSWLWTATKSFFRDFSLFGPKSDPRPSCFGGFLKDSGANFVGIPGVDTVAAAATAHYGISQSLAQAVPNTRVARGGISPKQWLAADEAARVSNAGKFSVLFNADVAMAQAFFQNELPAALAGECK